MGGARMRGSRTAACGAALLILLAATARAAVRRRFSATTYGASGATESLTITGVYFAEVVPAIEIPEKDTGGKLAPFGIRGFVNFGADEGFGDVITAG